MEAPEPPALEQFRSAGRALFSLGLVRGTEGNLSAFDGRVLTITRTGCSLGALAPPDLVSTGPGTDPLAVEVPDASSDAAVHAELYRARGPGAVVHAHPVGSVPEGGGGPGRHGIYVHASSLAAAVDDAVAEVRRSSAGASS
jgi:Class II Aldolase and Adducin N-terminal domain